MRDKNLLPGGNKGIAATAEKMMRTSVKSPAVMAMLMAPPTREEMMCYGGGYGPPPPPPPPTHQPGIVTKVSDEENEADEDNDLLATEAHTGSIGTLNGKPVFGPPRIFRSSTPVPPSPLRSIALSHTPPSSCGGNVLDDRLIIVGSFDGIASRLCRSAGLPGQLDGMRLTCEDACRWRSSLMD
ncbi:hypothetical protein LTR10_011844 [Elasticomyces elasticus]|nr:hypothetical protein LTR10_011844 [Elasticomyces elasticus]KAK4968789.1 hypothetical protein LTR42_009066 [Elasticomyces elasticus]